MRIEHESGESKGPFWTRIGDGPEAELTYSKSGQAAIIIDHTGVPDDYNREGLGVARAVEGARAVGK